MIELDRTYRAEEIADAFLSLTAEHGDLLTNLKLQKLLYYAQGWWLAFHGHPLFEEPLEAWIHGPVVANVFNRYKEFNHRPIITDFPRPCSDYPKELMDHIRDVWDAYGSFSAYDLEKLTHREDPWLKAREGLSPETPGWNHLDPETMRTYFTSRANDE